METKKHENPFRRRRGQTDPRGERDKEEARGPRRKKVRLLEIPEVGAEEAKTGLIFGLLIEEEAMEQTVHR